MGQVTKVLLLLAVVVPVTAYVAGSLASPGSPPPADHSPVILRDAPDDVSPATDRTAPPPARQPRSTPRPDPDDERDDRPGREPGRGDDDARVVTPQPTPVGEDDDDERDDGDDGDDDDDDTDDGDDDDADDGGDD